ncbi:MAG TPA: carboxylesterase [Pseudomonadales bacterium]|nr:carboxylesterase [Pseudomonadales bacterium]
MMSLSTIELEVNGPATAAVIWLHGLGADGNDFVPVVAELDLPATLGVRFIFPNAPAIPVTINAGYIMPAWYDILALSEERKINQAQFLASAAQVAALIEAEIARGIPSERIVLAGFSQGGAVAYQTALSFPRPLAGLLALSTYLINHAQFTPHPANKHLPIQILHGRFDSVVQESMGKLAFARLTELGYPVDYKNYPMEHELSLSEIADISTWLQARLQ